MSALAVLYLVIPLPLAFVVHEAEEIITQHKWMMSHGERLKRRFPRLGFLVNHLSQIDTKAFLIAALEEFFVLLGVTIYVFIQGNYATELWVAMFMAFSIHILIHLFQALIVRSYVPGVATSVVLLPYLAYGIWSIGLTMDIIKVSMLSIIGLLAVAINLFFSHKLGLKISKRGKL